MRKKEFNNKYYTNGLLNYNKILEEKEKQPDIIFEHKMYKYKQKELKNKYY